MNVYKEDAAYLVADDETKLVYARVPSASVATAVTLGVLNSYAFALPIRVPHLQTAWDAFDFDKNLYQVDFSRSAGHRFREFPQELLRDDLLARRDLIKERAYCIHCLEVYCQNHLTRIAEYMPEDLSGFLRSELESCDPSTGVYTNSIQEYGELMDIDPRTAYQELMLKLKSSSAVKLRNYALHQQMTMRVNASHTKEEFRQIFGDLFRAMLGGGYAKQ